jgi:hypothetical protein
VQPWLNSAQARCNARWRVRASFRRTVVCAAAGLSYGLALAVTAFLAAGFGHGSYVLAGLYSAPLSLFGSVPVALLCPPALWCSAGALLGRSSGPGGLAALVVLLVAHYASLPAILRPPGVFADWEYVARVKGIVWAGIVLYAAGQVTIWVTVAVSLLSKEQ